MKEKLLKTRSKVKKRKPKFQRKDSKKISKLGKRRKKKVKWRKPSGMHNKLRLKRAGYLRQPSIGWSSPKKVRGYIQDSLVKTISNVGDLEKINKGEMIIVKHIGRKKKIEIMKKAKEKNIVILNLKIKKYKKFLEKKNENTKSTKKDGSKGA